jgi:hypothetical protein
MPAKQTRTTKSTSSGSSSTTSTSESQKTPKEFAGREQELKPHSSVTGAGETSVHHAQAAVDPDYGADGGDNYFSTHDENTPRTDDFDR